MKSSRKGIIKRRYQFIERQQQVRFAVTVSLFALFFPFFIAALILLPVRSLLFLGEEAEAVRPAIMELASFCLRHFWVVLFALAFVAYASVLFSHKIFGPIRRFESALLQKKWNPDEKVFCSLRQRDYFQEFSKQLQEFLDTCQMPEPPFFSEISVQDEAVEAGETTDTQEEGPTAPEST
jgi:hypothetical protein